jgi:hypothetical protein
MSLRGIAGPNRSCESAAAIRAKSRFWRATMQRKAVHHENFFIAKNHDSESAPRAFSRPRSVAMTSTARRSFDESMTKMPAAQSLPTTLTVCGIGFSRPSRVAARMHMGVVDECAQQVCAGARQHFLKQDAVFFNVLVYSGCSAFDSRVHAAIKPSHYIRRATWPRKLRRQRKRRAQ